MSDRKLLTDSKTYKKTVIPKSSSRLMVRIYWTTESGFEKLFSTFTFQKYTWPYSSNRHPRLTGEIK